MVYVYPQPCRFTTALVCWMSNFEINQKKMVVLPFVLMLAPLDLQTAEDQDPQ